MSLVLCDPVMYSILPSEHMVTDPNDVKFANSLQIGQSTRHLFSIESDFSLANEMIAKYPILSDIDRQRFKVD